MKRITWTGARGSGGSGGSGFRSSSLTAGCDGSGSVDPVLLGSAG